MSTVLDGKTLTIEDVVRVARHGEKVELAEASVEAIVRCRSMLERKIEAREVMYGINTGIGEFSEVVLTDEQVRNFQKHLIHNHAAGIGEPFPVDVVRAAMVSRVNVHAQGLSGCRVEIPRTYVAMLNAGVTPVVCEKGSVGACGDLASMAQIALSLMGEGESFYGGERMPTARAMERAGIPVPGLQARDGLSAINGSNVIAGITAMWLYDAVRWVKQAEIVAAMTLEALLANMKPYNSRLHELRGFPGAVTCARNLVRVMEGSDLLTGRMKVKVQDAYSMRSTPQVIGALRDGLAYTRKQVEIELNGAADNPLFIAEDDLVLTGANFQGTPISMPLDMVAAGVTMVSVLSERRLNRLLNPALSVGLPAFLTKGAGMYSGLMLSQYTADMLIVEQRILSAPSCVQSIPAAADQEDFVSMGMNGALKARTILENAWGVLGIEAIAAAQALDFRDFTAGKGTLAAHAAVREVVEHLDVDRPLFNDHNAMAAAVQRCVLVDAVEGAIGELWDYNDGLPGSFSMTTEDDDLNQEDFASMLEESLEPRSFKEGELVEGSVVSVGKTAVFVDIGGKGEANIDVAELADEDGQVDVQVGDIVQGVVVSTRGGVTLSHKLARGAVTRQRLHDAYRSGLPVEGRVEKSIKGGFDVAIGNQRAFCPISQIDNRFTEEPTIHEGQSYTFRITEFSESGKNIVVSRRALLEEEEAERAEEVRGTIVANAELPGRVVSVRSYGAFVDLGGGIQGLLHVSEMGWSRVSDPNEVVQPGDEITVKVLRVEDDGKKIALGLKQLAPDPWSTAEDTYEAGQVLGGRVTRVTDFGVFVELEPGIEGLAHASTFPPTGKRDAWKSEIAPGASVVVELLSFELERKRIGLAVVPEGSKRSSGSTAAPTRGAIVAGARVTGKVERHENYGVFVFLAPGKTGLVPMAETGVERGGDLQKKFPVGSDLEVMVLEVDPTSRRIRLSVKAIAEAEQKREARDYAASQESDSASGFGTMAEKLRSALESEPKK